MVARIRFPRFIYLALLSGALGCETSPAAPSPRPLKNDACAERLHEVAGAFLLHYATHKRWPATEEEVAAALARGAGVPFVCPISNKPYVFNREGLRLPSMAGLILVQDADGAHSSFGWGVLVSPPGGTVPVTARIVALRSGGAQP